MNKRVSELIKKSSEELQDRLDMGKEVACPFIYEPIPTHLICRCSKVITEPTKCMFAVKELKDNLYLYKNRCFEAMPEQIVDMYATQKRKEINDESKKE
jgi:hypothetical protein